MALRAFHANPSIGGFGNESTSDILLLDLKNKQLFAEHQKNKSKNNKNKNNNGIIAGQNQQQSGDALCQIVKELVDNAIDACACCEEEEKPTSIKKKQRVKVEIHPYNKNNNNNDNDNDDDNTNDHHEILQITISDNGCGMEDIQSCVNAFGSSKHDGTTKTAGRYGIGLTLCLLHAQRLIPNSYSCITSATKKSQHFTRALYVVDTDGDSVRCDKKETIQKTNPDESGTCVSVLAPGGIMAELAWVRLANYFTRFRLSRGIKCSLEVFAPTLSKVPIFVKQLYGTEVEEDTADTEKEEEKESMINEESSSTNTKEITDKPWIDGFEDQEEDNDNNNHDDNNDENSSKNNDSCVKQEKERKPKIDPTRKAVYHAIQSFLGSPIKLQNVAHSIQPIRIMSPTITTATTNKSSSKNKHSGPKLEVCMAVRSLQDIPEDEGEQQQRQQQQEAVLTTDRHHYDEQIDSAGEDGSPAGGSSTTSTIELIRMVNHIPLLDSAEASACGLVTGLPNKDLWGSFGLRVESKSNLDPRSWVPYFEVQDSDQVAPFFRTHNHKLWEQQTENNNNNNDNNAKASGNGRREEGKGKLYLMPAKVRLAKILIAINIQAAPSSLPLPSLSKGRLPLNHSPITKALHVGLRSCLRSLQSTNPDLLLTASQLRTAEREAHHMPALALATSRIICRMRPNNSRMQNRLISTILGWGGDATLSETSPNFSSMSTTKKKGFNDGEQQEEILAAAIEKQIIKSIRTKQEQKAERVVPVYKKRKPTTTTTTSNSKKCKKKKEEEENEEFSDLDGSITEQEEDSSMDEESIPASSSSSSSSSSVKDVSVATDVQASADDEAVDLVSVPSIDSDCEEEEHQSPEMEEVAPETPPDCDVATNDDDEWW